MKYIIENFHSGRRHETVNVNTTFSLRNGGAESIQCVMICDDEGAVAFVPDAKKICALLSAGDL